MGKYSNDKGYALVLVLLFVMVIAITMAGLSLKMTNDLKQTDHEQDSQGAYYVAEGGVADVMQTVEARVPEIAAGEKTSTAFFTKFESEFLKTREVTSFQPNNGESPKAAVTITKVDNKIPRAYKIESVGSIGNRVRKVSGIFSLNFEEGKSGISFPPGMGVFAKTSINLNNGLIKGNILIDSTGKSVYVGGNPTIQGNIVLPVGSGNDIFSAPDWWIKQKAPTIIKNNINGDYPLPDFPDFPSYPLPPNLSASGHDILKDGNLNINHWSVSNYTYKLTQDVQFKNINLSSNYRLTFDTGSKDRSIVVNTIQGSGHIDIKGTGNLTIYIKDNISISGSFNEANKVRAYLYVGPSSNPSSPKTINSTSYEKFNASLYAYDANINIGGSAGINGHIITGGKKVNVSGGSSASAGSGGNIVYAPNASVYLDGGGQLIGSVISNSFTISGGGSVISKEINYDDSPFFPSPGNEPAEAKLNKPNLKEVD
ncbi:DUF7305 domain-containing protein [Edaphobacillus lindanitolerans]|uniref:DUF7305 domain-containing protein n=1 Tax=Edaphobacillus lindanitolerans TaxID=550447 RepID=A0A1U7PJZ0_9BACI|nr:hypothetical protein [Edaphobacillus lindanitolerans]SIT83270.1 hypothetical protein SAMN05428946_1598 [Edaphobacillus lindanitolerans]